MASLTRAIDIGPPTAQLDSLFYTLPPELRTIIFEFVVPRLEGDLNGAEEREDLSESDESTTFLTLALAKRSRRFRRRLAFLLSCRAFYLEACGLYYKHREIGLEDVYWGEAAESRHTHSRHRLASIQKVAVIIQDATRIMKLMAHHPKLKSLRFLMAGDDDRGMQTRSWRGQRQRSAVLWNRRLRIELKGLKQAMRKIPSLTGVEFVTEELFNYNVADVAQLREMEAGLNKYLKEREGP
ncbi:hypothetical protein CLAFUW4_04473 [Fulvia fulva]|uniref:F-box domain-containing protein n=1 Tax=Passalora fulva TaxID=5499 RepID=A0A9Q8LGU3_PASFU|nr:uncharacterized protein CLAFUR5_04438 [Fulvia fulva]KAK4626538.1 hypothetical protein CLAFUR4_04459 [Fulvia fulva]KAK4627592.1 hypothetical protein CLAFUR0_04462 [Fulvia fulva]UJO17156.1 hypothetical protein CLAFUR5_04438 [Fulvia fulva]WPV14008.1 hypothetical protein CLAFUW4_04473 [Fulvia fulva]WPV28438.1 hypothetical protein CLAFUW7_04465 [Fulvia fulva]